MKTLIVCCDGTWNHPDQGGGPTNVVKMSRAVSPFGEGGRPQVVYYDEGVGTGHFMDRFLGGTVGLGLNRNVQQAYQFLVRNYEHGDKIVMFGFSRGAFTVRSLAGLIGKFGLLRKGDLDKLNILYELYRKGTDDELEANKIKVEAHPDIDFLGVWDTVGTLGIPVGAFRWIGKSWYDFHDVKLNAKVKHACHAMAVDERRGPFRPTRWKTFTPEKGSLLAPDQTVWQVWFSGVHSNVGGGYPDRVLSDLAFLWMADQARPFLSFDEDYLQRKVERLRDGAWGFMEDSRKKHWKLFPQHTRVLGEDPTERVHRSVDLRRSNKRESDFLPRPYRPENVETYLISLQRAGKAVDDFFVD